MRGDEIDHIARIAEAWDGRGGNAFTPPTEHQLLLRAARLSPDLWNVSWCQLTPDQRMALAWTVFCVHNMRSACCWIFGEAEG